MQYFPLALPFLLALFLFFGFIVFLIEVEILQYAYEKVGVDRRHMFLLLFLSFMGSYVNIPIAHLPPTQVVTPEVVDFFGMRYVVPRTVTWPGTVIAVNVGGAAIPVILSVYLLVKNRLYARGLLAVALVAFAVHRMAHPVPGVGITIPTFIPPLVTAFVALVISWRHAAPLAYIAGSLGTLIGADLLNLGKVQGIGAPIASIGGAGKFDGIFLTGLIAVLLAGIVSRKK